MCVYIYITGNGCKSVPSGTPPVAVNLLDGLWATLASDSLGPMYLVSKLNHHGRLYQKP